MKDMRTALLYLAIALTLGCASMRGGTSPSPQNVVIDSAVAKTLVMMQYRLQGHPDYMDHEWVWCLKGEQRGDTVYVTDMGVTNITRMSMAGLSYEECNQPDYVGSGHNHPTSYTRALYKDSRADGCYFSTLDLETFARDDRALITVVTCANGRIIARGR